MTTAVTAEEKQAALTLTPVLLAEDLLLRQISRSLLFTRQMDAMLLQMLQCRLAALRPDLSEDQRTVIAATIVAGQREAAKKEATPQEIMDTMINSVTPLVAACLQEDLATLTKTSRSDRIAVPTELQRFLGEFLMRQTLTVVCLRDETESGVGHMADRALESFLAVRYPDLDPDRLNALRLFPRPGSKILPAQLRDCRGKDVVLCGLACGKPESLHAPLLSLKSVIDMPKQIAAYLLLLGCSAEDWPGAVEAVKNLVPAAVFIDPKG